MTTIKYKFPIGVWVVAIYDGSNDYFLGKIVNYSYDQDNYPMYGIDCNGKITYHYETTIKVLI